MEIGRILFEIGLEKATLAFISLGYGLLIGVQLGWVDIENLSSNLFPGQLLLSRGEGTAFRPNMLQRLLLLAGGQIAGG